LQEDIRRELERIRALLTTPPSDFKTEVLRGNIPGATVMFGMGERESISTGTAGEDLWRGNELSATPSAPTSHVLIPTPAAGGEQMTVISESAQDASGGTGAASILITYIDSAGAERTTPLILNGQTAVDLTPADVKFVQSMNVTTLGSTNTSGVGAGHIRIYQKADAGLVYNMIAAGGNMSLVPHRMVPAGKTLYLQSWNASEGNNKRLRIRIRADATLAGVVQPGVPLFRGSVYVNQSTSGDMPLGVCLPAGTVVKVSGWATVGNGEAATYWWGYLVDD